MFKKRYYKYKTKIKSGLTNKKQFTEKMTGNMNIFKKILQPVFNIAIGNLKHNQ